MVSQGQVGFVLSCIRIAFIHLSPHAKPWTVPSGFNQASLGFPSHLTSDASKKKARIVQSIRNLLNYICLGFVLGQHVTTKILGFWLGLTLSHAIEECTAATHQAVVRSVAICHASILNIGLHGILITVNGFSIIFEFHLAQR